MKITRDDWRGATVALSIAEVHALTRLLDCSVRAWGIGEFETVMGCSVEHAIQLYRELGVISNAADFLREADKS